MSNIVQPLPSIGQFVQALLVAQLPGLKELPEAQALKLVDGDFAFSPSKPFYIRVSPVGGQSNRLEGDRVVDLEVFAVKYLAAESRSLDIEALLLGYPHVVEAGDRKVVFDKVYQNKGPTELPWEDEGVSRLGATYVFTIRRS